MASPIPEPEILYEDNHIIAVNKPPGILVQGDKTGDVPLIEIVREWIRKKYNKPGNVFTGLVHRLDRPVSGVVLFAKTSKALGRSTALFRNREITKTYLAISDQQPVNPEGRLINFIEKDKDKNKVRILESGSKSQKAELSYRMLAIHKNLALLEINPETGRPHQIRVQLSSMGTPIAGDKKYKSEYKTGEGYILLHARSLKFIHPVKKEEIMIKAPAPNIKEWRFFSHLIE